MTSKKREYFKVGTVSDRPELGFIDVELSKQELEVLAHIQTKLSDPFSPRDLLNSLISDRCIEVALDLAKLEKSLDRLCYSGDLVILGLGSSAFNYALPDFQTPLLDHSSVFLPINFEYREELKLAIYEILQNREKKGQVKIGARKKYLLSSLQKKSLIITEPILDNIMQELLFLGVATFNFDGFWLKIYDNNSPDYVERIKVFKNKREKPKNATPRTNLLSIKEQKEQLSTEIKLYLNDLKVEIIAKKVLEYDLPEKFIVSHSTWTFEFCQYLQNKTAELVKNWSLKYSIEPYKIELLLFYEWIPFALDDGKARHIDSIANDLGVSVKVARLVLKHLIEVGKIEKFPRNVFVSVEAQQRWKQRLWDQYYGV
jgi:hypothetical protein